MSSDREGQPEQIQLEQALLEDGIPMHAVSSALQIDEIMQAWRRRMAKRELGLEALREMRSDLELTQLDVLMVIAMPAEDSEGKSETLIGTVAQRMLIDPSRASRLVSDLVVRGLVERGISQTDSRRAVLKLTEDGQAVVDAVRMHKFKRLGAFLADWSKEELEQFLPLLRRFSDWASTKTAPAQAETAKDRDTEQVPVNAAS